MKIFLQIVLSSFLYPLDINANNFDQTTYDILMVVKRDLGGSTEEADIVIQDTLQQWGYSVNIVDQGNYEFEDHSIYRLVYFSESINSEFAMHYKNSGYPIPAYAHEPYLLDRMQLGRVNQEARNQQAVIEEMKIIASNHPITNGIWESGQLLKVTENATSGTHDVFQFEFDLDDLDYDSRLLYNVLGTTNLTNNPWKGYPTWAHIYGGEGGVPSNINIIVHAFHLGTSLKATPVFWQQMQRSIQYLLDELEE